MQPDTNPEHIDTNEQQAADVDEHDGSTSHAPTVSRTTGDPTRTREFAIECARLFKDDKCEHIVVLDVRGLSQVTDYVIVGSGTSDRQMSSAIDDVIELGERYEFSAMRTNRDDRSTWLLADFVDVIAHLFEPETRAFYDIEMLWGDAPRIEWQRPNDSPCDGDDA